MKTYKRGLITGIILTISAFLFMGQSNRWEDNSSKNIGMYQASSVTFKSEVYTTVINTTNGNVYRRILSPEYQYSKYR